MKDVKSFLTESREQPIDDKMIDSIWSFVNTLDIKARVSTKLCEENEVGIFVSVSDWSKETARIIAKYMEKEYGAGLVDGAPAGGFKWMKFRLNTETKDYYKEKFGC